MAIPTKIRQLANDVRNKIYGKDVRESIAKGMEESGNIADDAKNTSKNAVDRVNIYKSQFDQSILDGDQPAEVQALRVDPLTGEVYTTAADRFEANQKSFEKDLLKNKKYANVEFFGAVADFDEVNNNGTDNTQSFIAASNFAKENDLEILVPEGKFLIDGELEIFNSIVGEGELFFPSENINAVLKISSANDPIELNPLNLSGLFEGSDKIGGLYGNYINHTLIIDSEEILIERFNPPYNIPYTKKEVAIITSGDGKIMPSLDETYDKSKIKKIHLMPPEKRLNVDIKFCAFGSQVKETSLIELKRSNVKFRKIASRVGGGGDIRTHININDCALTEFDSATISKSTVPGYGYGISIGNSAFTFVDKANITECNHALSGRHGKNVSVNGGLYSKDIDSHYGYNYVIKDIVLEGSILYSGKNIIFKESKVNTNRNLVAIRQDAPDFRGNMIVENISVKFPETEGNLLYATTGSGFSWTKQMELGDSIVFNRISVASNTNTVWLQNMGDFYKTNHRPTVKMVFKDIQGTVNKPTFRFTALKDRSIQTSINYNPQINFESIDFNNVNETYASIYLEDRSDTITKSWGYSFNIDKSAGVVISADGTAITNSKITDSDVIRFGRVNVKNDTLGVLTFDNVVFDNATLRGETYFDFINCIFKVYINTEKEGAFNNLNERVRRSFNNSIEIGTGAVPTYIRENYKNPKFFID